MKKRIRRLHEAQEKGRLIRVYRHFHPDWSDYGYVVGLSDEWVLLHGIDGNSLHLNGYQAYRLKDIVKTRFDKSCAERALRLRGERAVRQPDTLLVDLPGLLSSANAHFPLVNIHLDEKEPDSCYIGRIEKITRKKVLLREITSEARWNDSPHRFPLKHITCVAFASGYEEALWLVAEQEQRLAEEREQ